MSQHDWPTTVQLEWYAKNGDIFDEISEVKNDFGLTWKEYALLCTRVMKQSDDETVNEAIGKVKRDFD